MARYPFDLFVRAAYLLLRMLLGLFYTLGNPFSLSSSTVPYLNNYTLYWLYSNVAC